MMTIIKKKYAIISVVFFLLFMCISPIYAQSITHTVKKGETLKSIAEKYGVTEEDILKENKKMGKRLYFGMKLTIPPKNISQKATSEKESSEDAVGNQEPSNESNEKDRAIVADSTKHKSGSSLSAEGTRSIAIMPPINETNHVEAKDYFYSTLYIPLCDLGYYVFPPMLTMEMFQTESAYDSEMFINGDLSKFGNILGADALMFTTIKNWKRANAAGIITVYVDYVLRSTKTNEILWQNGGSYTINLNIKTGVPGIWGTLANLAATMVATASTEKIKAGRACNIHMLASLPVGPYHPRYKQ